MRNDEDGLNGLGESLGAVLASIESCRAYEHWRKIYRFVEDNGASYVDGEYENISDATMLFSLISLRKIDEFLSTGRKNHDDDLRYSDFGICRKDILLDRRAILSQKYRKKINKTIVHFTKSGDPCVKDWKELHQELESSKEPLKRLEKTIRQLLKIPDQS